MKEEYEKVKSVTSKIDERFKSLEEIDHDLLTCRNCLEDFKPENYEEHVTKCVNKSFYCEVCQ